MKQLIYGIMMLFMFFNMGTEQPPTDPLPDAVSAQGQVSAEDDLPNEPASIDIADTSEDSTTKEELNKDDVIISSEIPPEMIYSKEIPIFVYHHISDTDAGDAITRPDTFEAHIKALADSGVEAVFFQDLIDFVYDGGTLPDNPILITFDHGYTSNYDMAFPILEKYNMKSTMFVTGIAVGQDTYPDTNYSMIPHFSYEEAQIMLDSGLVDIQSHTYNMNQWAPFESGIARSNALQLEEESDEAYAWVLSEDYRQSKAEIEANTSATVQVYSYPGGVFSDSSEQILAEAGALITVSINEDEPNMIHRNQGGSLFGMTRFTMDNVTDLNYVLEKAGVSLPESLS